MVGGAEFIAKRSPLEITSYIATEFGKAVYNPRRDAELGHDEYVEQLAEASKYFPDVAAIVTGQYDEPELTSAGALEHLSASDGRAGAEDLHVK